MSAAAKDAPAGAASLARRAAVTGLVLMLGAGIASSIIHVGVRLLAPTMPVIEIVFFRAAFTVLISLPMLVAVESTAAFRTRAPGLQLLRGIFAVGSIVLWYYALATLPLADAGALSFTQGLFIALGAALFFGERVGPWRWSALAIGLVGTLIMLRPGTGVVSVGAIAALVSALLWTITTLLAKLLARHDSSATISLYQPLLTVPVALLAALPTWVWPDATALAILLGMGVLAAVSNYALIHAVRIADASLIMPVDYLRLVWMTAWGYTLFAELPDLTTVLGAALIIVSTSAIAWRESRRTGSGG